MCLLNPAIETARPVVMVSCSRDLPRGGLLLRNLKKMTKYFGAGVRAEADDKRAVIYIHRPPADGYMHNLDSLKRAMQTFKDLVTRGDLRFIDASKWYSGKSEITFADMNEAVEFGVQLISALEWVQATCADPTWQDVPGAVMDPASWSMGAGASLS
jgi:hypothetical protein